MDTEPKQPKSIEIRLTAAHVRAARGLLHWSLETLSERCNIAVQTINKWENGKQQPRESTRQAVRKAFTDAGITFSNGKSPGVKLDREP